MGENKSTKLRQTIITSDDIRIRWYQMLALMFNNSTRAMVFRLSNSCRVSGLGGNVVIRLLKKHCLCLFNGLISLNMC